MAFSQIVLLFIAAILGGTLNAVAGGGSFITLPSLIFTGVLPINSNATSTVALWPGSVASIGAYRKELMKQKRTQVLLLSSTSLIGGILGAFLLLGTSQTTFIRLLPYLLLIATVLFTISGPLTARMRQRQAARSAVLQKETMVEQDTEQADMTVLPSSNPVEKHSSWLVLVGTAFLQLIIAIYGGYFGGGIGILMLASLGLMGMENIHEMNAMKTLLTTCINGVALIIFVAKGVVVWPQAILMIVGAIIGGFGGAYFARKLNPLWVRWFVIAVGLGMTIYFFIFS
ncbi:MAG: sulfite exporter TauE/SafE family protein [Ktedonobacteraceae bacterium]